jgi:hypothetical protein
MGKGLDFFYSKGKIKVQMVYLIPGNLLEISTRGAKRSTGGWIIRGGSDLGSFGENLCLLWPVRQRENAFIHLVIDSRKSSKKVRKDRQIIIPQIL